MSVSHVKPGEVETWQQKFMRRFKEEPFVPIGMSFLLCVQCKLLNWLVPTGTALTCFALFMASRKLGKKGESKSLNRWFRARIIFQGATIGAIVAGSYAVKKKADGAGATQETPSAEELRLKERLEFEDRLRKAEENHAIEEAMRGGRPKQQEKGIWARLGLGRGPAGNVQATQIEPPPTAPVGPTSLPLPPEPATQTPAETSSQSSWGWFGRNSSHSSDSEKK